MVYRTLGKDLNVSAVGLGCMGMSHVYGAPTDKKEMVALLAKAVDMVYTFLVRVLATKFGIHFDMDSRSVNKPSAVEIAALNKALERIPMSAVFGGSRIIK